MTIPSSSKDGKLYIDALRDHTSALVGFEDSSVVHVEALRKHAEALEAFESTLLPHVDALHAFNSPVRREVYRDGLPDGFAAFVFVVGALGVLLLMWYFSWGW